MSERITRRRNVTTRERTGCVTCRARRLKCDEGKPDCNNCLRLQLRCGGYPSRIVFRDQTDLLKRKHQERHVASRTPAKARLDSSAGLPVPPVSPGIAAAHAQAAAESSTHVAAPERSSRLHGSPTATNGVSSAIDEPSSPHETGCCDSVVYEAASSLAAISTTTFHAAELPAVPAVPGSVDHELRVFTPKGERAASVPSSEGHGGQHGGGVGYAAASAALGSPLPDTYDEHGAGSDPGSHVVDKGTPAVSTTGGDSGLTVAPIAPLGLFEAAKFPQDVLYYHHLRDSSPGGLLSILLLNDIFRAEYLDRGFFSAALALSALSVSQTSVSRPIAENAALHALDHYVSALGMARLTAIVDGETPNNHMLTSSPAQAATTNPHKVTCRLAIILFLALFDLQRGQLRPWSVHSRAAVTFLCEHIDQVRLSAVGESLIRSFARLVVLLEIYDRTFSARAFPSPSPIAASLVESLAFSPFPSDRLLVIIPRVIELEEDWRSNPMDEPYWQEKAEVIKHDLFEWRSSLAPGDLPAPDFDESEHVQRVGEVESISSNPIRFPNSPDPTRSATNLMHYLVSLLRVQTRYSRGGGRMLPPGSESTVVLVCQMAAGILDHGGADTHAYGHGILPALMNAYYLSENEQARAWIKNWLLEFPREREGIWNVGHAQRLIAYIDDEYGRRGPRSGWTIIRVRFVDLDEDVVPRNDGDSADPNTLAVEIYARSKRGWGIEFIEVP